MGRPAAKPVPRTIAQNSRIWALTSELGRVSGLGADEVKDVVLRPAVLRASGQESTTRLTATQAGVVIDVLEKAAAEYRAKAPAAPPKPAPDSREKSGITPAMQTYISNLFDLLGIADVAGRREFCMRQCKRPWPQTQEEADALVEPLKSRVVRRFPARDLMTRFRALQGNPGLDTWQKGFVADICEKFARAEKAGRIDRVLKPAHVLKLFEAEQRCGVAQ